jgi:uncharacterized protein (TIGR02996 family)
MSTDDRAISANEDAFLRSIREKPHDEAPRLVYADWLDECGDPRSEFLRLEIQVRQSSQRLEEIRGSLDQNWVTAVEPQFRVILVACQPEGVFEAVLILRAITDLGIADSQGVIAAAPCPLPDRYCWFEANQIRAALRRCAKVTIEPYDADAE